MDIPLFVVISVIFLFINGKIILSDIKHKKIPNRSLLFLVSLLPFFYTYLFVKHNLSMGISTFFIQILVSVALSFFLYYHGVWSAGDAKYLLVLSLYLPAIGIIPFVGNLALITTVYLLGYYIYFYGKLFFGGSVYKNSFLENVFVDQKDTLRIFLRNHRINRIETKRAIYSVLKFVLIFLVFFISIRLARSYLLEDLKNISIVGVYIAKYPTHTVLVLGGCFFLLFYSLKRTLIKIKARMNELATLHWHAVDLNFIFTFFIFLLLASFIGYEYMTNPKEISHKLFLILTLYLGLFFVFKVLFYSYKLTFQLGEQDIIPISQLQPGDIVDREYLIKLFGSQESLGSEEKRGLLTPNPYEFFQNMENPIDRETSKTIKRAYLIVNRYHKKQKTPGFEAVHGVKILKMFSFGIYIFLGFFITFVWGELPFRIIVGNVIRIFHSHY